jgi:hypothetical protein
MEIKMKKLLLLTLALFTSVAVQAASMPQEAEAACTTGGFTNFSYPYNTSSGYGKQQSQCVMAYTSCKEYAQSVSKWTKWNQGDLQMCVLSYNGYMYQKNIKKVNEPLMPTDWFGESTPDWRYAPSNQEKAGQQGFLGAQEDWDNEHKAEEIAATAKKMCKPGALAASWTYNGYGKNLCSEAFSACFIVPQGGSAVNSCILGYYAYMYQKNIKKVNKPVLPKQWNKSAYPYDAKAASQGFGLAQKKSGSK